MGNTSVVEKWVDEAAALTKPTKVTWADGSKQEYDRLVESMLRDSTLLELNQKTYPGCYLHRSHPQDVARTEQLTFICTRDKDDAGPSNDWMEPAEAKAKAGAYLKNSMKERQMWVIPYLMGPARLGASRTGSWSRTRVRGGDMRIMTRVDPVAFDNMRADDDFIAGLHGMAILAGPAAHPPLPEEKLIWSWARATGATRCSAKCHAPASGRPRRGGEAGWPSTCSFSAWRTPRGAPPFRRSDAERLREDEPRHGGLEAARLPRVDARR
jgi:phosphoenolpyruvate carboxykinase (GTP)